jgi:sirohydrochlorin ferrochelatase
MPTALLLIAHGSRQAEANADLFALAGTIREAERYAIVEAAFLELAEPAIDVAGRKCVALGAERVILAPYFLSAGVHVRRDLQRYRDELAAEFPAVTFVLAEPLGPHPMLSEIVLQRATEADVRIRTN